MELAHLPEWVLSSCQTLMSLFSAWALMGMGKSLE